MGIGIDIVEINRFKKIRHLDRFLELVFSPCERSELRSHSNPYAFIASRFAVKEAVIKAVPFQVIFRDIEIRKDKDNQPYVNFLNNHRADTGACHVSLSHSEYSAVGMATFISV